MAVSLKALVDHLNDYLGVADFPDYPTALNGLQVENSGEVTKVAAAVDASERAIEAAIATGADLLVVHHGLFWDGKLPVTGRRHRRLRRLIEADVAVYSAHLPLDAHMEVGNAAVLARALGVEVDGRVGSYKGEPIGVSGKLELRREALAARLDELVGDRVRLIAGGPERIRRVGVITGAGAGLLKDAIEAGLDGLVTGEASHQHYFDATEGGINLYLGGHYATETWGVKALAEHLEREFGLPWIFLDQPTGI